MYFVGRGGSIAHYNGSGWTKIESGTGADINDIYGSADKVNKVQVYAAVSNRFETGEKVILNINDQQQVKRLNWEPQRIVSSIWSPNGRVLYTAGDGIYNNKAPNVWSTFFMQLPSVYTYKVRGNGLNDIFVSGDYGLIGHFNGKHWKSYPELNLTGYQLFGLNVKENLLCVVGSNADKAIIIMGKR